jgi:hypothetical protein
VRVGIFGNQALRLLREKWSSPNELAEELYAILNSNVPMTLTGPVTINNSSPTKPALTVRNFGQNDQGVNIQKRPLLQGPNFPPIPGITFPPLGVFGDGTLGSNLGSQGQAQQQQQPGGGGFPGKVLSGGPGATYKVAVYQSGLGGKPTTVSVTQLQIDPAETIPAGTWAMVSQVGSSYYMQVPVWGAS